MKTLIKIPKAFGTIPITKPGFARACTMLCIGIILLTINPLSAQNGDPPPPPGEHGQNGNQPPGSGAPITGGIGILMALGATYGGRRCMIFTSPTGGTKKDRFLISKRSFLLLKATDTFICAGFSGYSD